MLSHFTILTGVLALKYDVLEQLIIDSSMSCALRCLAKKLCVGFNFKRRAKKKQINCQLTISLDNKFSKDGSEGDSDWDFYKVVGPRKVRTYLYYSNAVKPVLFFQFTT
jgi:hypothetical protein